MIEEKKSVQKVNFPLAELSTLELWLLIRIPWSLVLKVENVITDIVLIARLIFSLGHKQTIGLEFVDNNHRK